MFKWLITGILVVSLVAPSSAGPAEDAALRAAAGALDINSVKSALEKGANPNSASETTRRFTPLSETAFGLLTATDSVSKYVHQFGLTTQQAKDHLAGEILSILFAAGARLGPFDREILFFPISEGCLEVVKILMLNNASVLNKLSGFTPAELAVRYGQDKIYRFLISHGAIPVSRDNQAQLVLVQAAGSGDIDAMKRAISDGALVNSPDTIRQTALVAALRLGINQQQSFEVISWLLENGADPNRNSESHYSNLEGIPLHLLVAMALKRPESQNLLERSLSLLLDKGAKVSGMDSRGRTPLHIAAKNDQLRAAEILIKRGAKIMPVDAAGKNPLDYAESERMIQLLKKNGATER